MLPKYKVKGFQQDYDYEGHALDALEGLMKLFRHFRTLDGARSQEFMPTPPGLVNREGRNLCELHKFISADEILDLESVTSLKLMATEPELLSGSRFLHATVLPGNKADKYFISPGCTSSFYVNIKFLP